VTFHPEGFSPFVCKKIISLTARFNVGENYSKKGITYWAMMSFDRDNDNNIISNKRKYSSVGLLMIALFSRAQSLRAAEGHSESDMTLSPGPLARYTLLLLLYIRMNPHMRLVTHVRVILHYILS